MTAAIKAPVCSRRFGMAYRLFRLDAFVRPESEQYCSHPRLYCSEPVEKRANLQSSPRQVLSLLLKGAADSRA